MRTLSAINPQSRSDRVRGNVSQIPWVPGCILKFACFDLRQGRIFACTRLYFKLRDLVDARAFWVMFGIGIVGLPREMFYCPHSLERSRSA